MEPSADDILRNEGKDAPHPDDMLQEAEWLNEKGLGYPLNFMCSLYYEVTPEDLQQDIDLPDDSPDGEPAE